MTTSTSLIKVGRVYGDHSEVAGAIEGVFGVEPDYLPIPGLAGPNELVQLLASIEGWEVIGKAIASIYGAAMVAEAGKDTWRALAPNIYKAPTAIQEKFIKLVEAFQKEREAGQDVSIGLVEPVFDGHARADRVYLIEISPEEVARHLYIFSQSARPLTQWLSAVYKSQKNPGDVYVCIEITDGGNLIATLKLVNIATNVPLGIVKKIFDSKGNLISESA